jgi:hypothetical protein
MLTLNIGPNDLLVKLNCTGLCMSDVHYMLKDLPLPVQMDQTGVRSPGHEGAGVVVQVGSNVTDWKIGDRAGIKPMMDTCHNCELCWNGIEYVYRWVEGLLEPPGRLRLGKNDRVEASEVRVTLLRGYLPVWNVASRSLRGPVAGFLFPPSLSYI